MNKTIDMKNGVTAVILRNAEHKEVLKAGEDFFYVDTESISKLRNIKKDWTIIKRVPKYSVSTRDEKRNELRLSRFLTGLGNNPNDRSLITKFANGLFYDLRMKNILVGTRRDQKGFEEKRHMILPELKKLPLKIKNDFAEKNGHSLLQRSSTANSLNIHRAVTFELNITSELKLQCCAFNREEEKVIAEAMKVLQERATVVSR